MTNQIHRRMTFFFEMTSSDAFIKIDGITFLKSCHFKPIEIRDSKDNSTNFDHLSNFQGLREVWKYGGVEAAMICPQTWVAVAPLTPGSDSPNFNYVSKKETILLLKLERSTKKPQKVCDSIVISKRQF